MSGKTHSFSVEVNTFFPQVQLLVAYFISSNVRCSSSIKKILRLKEGYAYHCLEWQMSQLITLSCGGCSSLFSPPLPKLDFFFSMKVNSEDTFLCFCILLITILVQQ